MEALLSVSDLYVRYPLHHGLSLPGTDRPSFVDVVHGVSMEINRGETMAIVGESGSGKTTLAMALCGLSPVHAGKVSVDGKNLERDRRGRLKPDRKRLAFMFQDPVGSRSPRMTIRNILTEPFLIHQKGTKQKDGEAMRLLTLVGLDGSFADRYPHQLSGGQARRVGVARALALRPDILIADEPTAGLDVSIQGEILNLLSRLQRDMGLGIMFITHNLNVVRHVADQMAVMYLGRFVEQGESQEIFRQPRHPYTSALLSANPNPDPNVPHERIELKGEVPSLLQRPAGCEFHTRCPIAVQKCSSAYPESFKARGRHTFNCYYPMGPDVSNNPESG